MKKARNATKNAASGMKRSMAAVATTFNRVAKSMFSFRSAAVLAAGAAGLGLLVRKAISVADEIAKTADKIGFTTKALQELRFAAGRAGIGQQELDKSLEQFTRRIGEAAGGTGEALQSYKDLGIQLRDTNGNIKDSSTLLGEVAEALVGIESPAERANAAYDLFGRQGVGIANLLFKDGKKGLDEYAAAAARLGIVIEEDILRKAETANDQIEDMGKVFAKTGTVLALEFMPILQDVAKLLTDPAFLESLKNIIKQFKGIVTFGGFAVEQMSKTISGLKNIVDPGEIVKATAELRRLRKEAELLFKQQEAIKSGVIGASIPSSEENEKAVRENLKKRRAIEKRLDALNAGIGAKIPEKVVISGTKTPPKTKHEVEVRIPVSVAPVFGPIDDAALERIEVDLAKALQKAQDRFKVFGNETKLAEERLAAFERAMDSLIEAGALERSPELIANMKIEIEDLRESLKKTENKFEDIEDSFKRFTDSMVSGTQDIGDAFRQLAIDVVQALIKMTQEAILSNNQISKTGSGGIFETLITSFSGGLGGLFSSPSIPTLPVAPPSALSLPGISVPTMARGRLVTSPTLALIGEEGPEAVVPLKQLNDGGGDLIVNVFNNSPARVRTSQSTGVDGRKQISLFIEEEVSNNIRNGGRVANAISQTFGTNRQGAIR